MVAQTSEIAEKRVGDVLTDAPMIGLLQVATKGCLMRIFFVQQHAILLHLFVQTGRIATRQETGLFRMRLPDQYSGMHVHMMLVFPHARRKGGVP